MSLGVFLKGELMYHIRQATKEDIPTLLYFIHQIAIYEKMDDQVQATESLLEEWMFEKKIAEAIILSEDQKDVGFALYFFNFSTFVGKGGLYLEDLFVLSEYRKKGYGKALFKALVQKAVDHHCGRMEWVCLNWNQSSIDFYRSMGAKPLDEWTTYRLTEAELNQLL